MRTRTERRGRRLLGLALGGAIALASWHCSDGGGRRTDSESHFMQSCLDDGDCGGALACVCNVCTATCEQPAECGALDGTTCVPAEAPAVARQCGEGGQPSSGMCLLPCSGGSACADVGGEVLCLDGYCLVDDVALDFPGDTGPDGDAGADGDAGGDDAPVGDVPDEPEDDGAAADGGLDQDDATDAVGDGDGGGLARLGEPCEGPEDCADGLPCSDFFGGRCAHDCSAAELTCPDGTLCFVPGDLSGLCLAPCAVCGLTDCGPGLVCSPDFQGLVEGFLCVPEELSRIPGECVGSPCGSSPNGCYCGACEADLGCFTGDCVAADTCPGTPCVDAFEALVCEGESSYVACPGNPGSLRVCQCSGAGADAWISCGECRSP